jgi:2-(1,2-epoxy-1,2-dihydrophenyl)acetyl-CoA isomerase
MAFESLRIALDGGVCRLTLTDAARGNPIDGRFCAELKEAAIQISQMEGVRAILLDAEGKAFSFGGDIASFTAELDHLPLVIKRWASDLNSAIIHLQRLDVPMVAAVHGVCAGGMVGIVAGCDIVVAAEEARFVAAYAGIGYCCDAGVSIMVSRRMGLSRARRYLLLNETLSSGEALAGGLVDFVEPADGVVARAEEIAGRLAKGPTLAFGEMRRLMLSASDQPLETQLELEAQGLARMAGTADAREGITAFAEKRKPSFSGR